MKRRHIIVALGLSLISACRMEGSAAIDPSRVDIDTAGAVKGQSFTRSEFARITQIPAGDQYVCVLEAEALPPPLVLLEYAALHGGATCGSASKPLIFYPLQNGQCPRRLNISGEISKLPISEAAEDFRTCLLSGVEAGFSNASLTFIKSSEITDQNDARFAQFVRSIMAMIYYDALPVRSVSSYASEAVCLEGPNLTDALDRITTADVVEDGVADYAFNTGSCDLVIDDFVRSAAGSIASD